MFSAIEGELHRTVDRIDRPDLAELRHMLSYHLGWEGQGAGPQATGKRIRPLLLVLTCAAAGGEWLLALPAAAAVELLHNFSLIHDDIQDNSPLRRGRPTVWKRWGIAQAINAGDAMFTLANLALLRLAETTSPNLAIQASRILQDTCLHLTAGQFLDISYESRGDLTLEAYWPMVSGKTAALLAACTELGALVAGVPEDTRSAYRQFGHALGLAFQAHDDLLGMWGDEALTGKSAESDLVSGKKSLPVLYGLSHDGPFAWRWTQGAIEPVEVPALAAELEAKGARQYTQDTANHLTNTALEALERARPRGAAGEALVDLARRLLKRQK
jgi:geranylgeranyl diphosphate synthase type I